MPHNPMTETNTKIHQVLKGTVVSDKMKDTVVVRVERYVKHKKYGKYLSRGKRYKAHNPGNTSKVGDVVFIEACSPISKEKRFRVVSV